jgi:hypothetical protein
MFEKRVLRRIFVVLVGVMVIVLYKGPRFAESNPA